MSSAGTIDSVRVFIDRATITRSRTVQLQPGLQTVAFEVLPSALDPDTLRAQATSGAEPLSVLGVQCEVVYSEPTSARSDEVRARLERVQAELRALEDASGNDEHAVQMVSQYAGLATDALSLQWLDSDPEFSKWANIFDQLRDNTQTLASRQAERRFNMQQLQLHRDELEHEQLRLGQRTSKGHRVLVNVKAPPSGGPVHVQLSYVTRSAQWMPGYDARLIEGQDTLQVRWTAVALVRQTTGEDWSDVRVIATTARPPLSEPPPPLHRLQVAGYQAAPNRDVEATHDAGARLSGAGAGAPAASAAVEHEAPGQVSIPSTSKPVRVELFEELVPAQRRLEVAPLHREIATWVLDLENTTGRVLLPGTVNLFRGANYSGRAEVGFVQGSERFRLPLATEGSLRITRTTHARPARKTAVMGDQIFEYDTHTKLHNAGPEAVEVLVLDRVPVSRSEEVKVQRTALPHGTKVQEETGQLSLPVTVPAHDSTSLTISFRITAPRGVSVQPPELL